MGVLFVWLLWWKGLGVVNSAGLSATVVSPAENILAKPTGLNRSNVAVFTLNGWISVLLFAAASIDLFGLKAL